MLDDSDRTPRKPSAHGLPTPPLSEATSSASGSVGRARRHSNEPNPASEQLMIPSQVPGFGRPPSAASSRTGSDTVGARSPVDLQGSFRSTRLSSDSPTGASLRYSSSTLGRRRGSGLSFAVDDASERTATLPAASRLVPRAQSSLGMRSNFADEGRRTSLNLSRLGEETVAAETPDRSERKRRSLLHEQDVTQIRSESRLGQNDILEEDGDSPRKRAHQFKFSLRKAGILVQSRYAAEDESTEPQISPSAADHPNRSPSTTFLSISRSSAGRNMEDPPDNRPATSIGTRGDYGVARRSLGSHMNPDEASSTSARRRSLKGNTEEATVADSSVQRKSTSVRSPIPLEFRLPDKEARKAWRAAHAQEQSDSVTSDTSEDDDSRAPPKRKASTADSGTRAASSQTVTSASIESYSASRSTYRRKRYASDAQADELPAMDYDGRLGSQGSRISVDTSSANRYLSKGSLQGTPHSGRGSSRASEMGSPSEEARIRKVSTSSSRSQKSSGGASELHRTASRVSMRRAHGRDVFDDEVLPPLPGSRSDSPALRSDTTSASDRLRALRQRVGELKDASHSGRLGWWNELDDLRNRIEELAVAGPKAAASGSRSSSVQSHRTHSALGLHRTPIDSSRIRRAPTTEPRNLRHDRSATLSDLGSGELNERSTDAEVARHHRPYSRTTIARSHASIDPSGRGPMTPDPHSAQRLAAGSRASIIQSATLPSTARFPSTSLGLANPRIRSEGASEASHPVHDRNMRNAFDMFERYFCSAPSTSSSAPAAAGPESIEMVASFGEVVAIASELNAGLRDLIQAALEAQVDAEMRDRNGTPVSQQALDCFARFDRDLSDLLKRSDEQVRNLTEGLMAVTRAERERDRQRKAAMNDHGFTIARSTSRVSMVASPVEEIRRSLDARSGPALNREPASPAGTVVDHGSAEKRSDRFRSADRYSHTQRAPASPYSPLQAKTNAATFGGTLTASQMRSMAPSSAHARSASEYSPGMRLRREKSTLADIVKPPLSPRRPKLSFPSVSNATASYNPATHGEASTVEAQAAADGITFPSSHEGAGSSLARAHKLISEPMELDDREALAHTAQWRSGLEPAGPPFSGHSRRNTIAEAGTVDANASGLGIEPVSPESERRGASEHKRLSRSERPTWPPRHDLMRRDTEEEAHNSLAASAASIDSTESVAGENRESGGISRFSSISRSLGRTAAKRISRTFAAAQESEARNATEETRA
ncbi:hypothetical protein ACQY0O_006831 [Thecaphora frezii]